MVYSSTGQASEASSRPQDTAVCSETEAPFPRRIPHQGLRLSAAPAQRLVVGHAQGLPGLSNTVDFAGTVRGGQQWPITTGEARAGLPHRETPQGSRSMGWVDVQTLRYRAGRTFISQADPYDHRTNAIYAVAYQDFSEIEKSLRQYPDDIFSLKVGAQLNAMYGHPDPANELIQRLQKKTNKKRRGIS